MTLQRVLMVSVAVLMLASAAASQGNRSPEARLRAAMDKETVDGDLKAAIDGYKQVISQSGASRTVVAQALLRLGMAYEKQGDAEARKSYERLVRDFGDQPAIVQQAAARMAAVGPVVAFGPTLRQVCSGTCPVGYSFDGRWLLSMANSQLTVSDLSTRTSRQVASAPPGRGMCCAAMSPDARRIAYTLGSPPAGLDPNAEIVVANVDGSAARTVYRGAVAEAWSPDGRRLLAVTNHQPSNLLWVTVADGTAQAIPTTGWENLDMVMVSPDGRYVAFSGNRGASTSENVFLIASDGSGETRVSPSPDYQEPVGWSPDGRNLLFAQVGATTTLWSVPVANGRPGGAPVTVRRFDQRVTTLGITPSGTLLYRALMTASDPYTASMDPATGKVTSLPAVLPTPNPGGPAVWSPDGRRIAFLHVGPNDELHVFSLADGKDQRIPAQVSFGNGLCWSSSGDAILTNAPSTLTSTTGPRSRFDAVRVDLATGDTRPVFPEAPGFRIWDCTQTTATSLDARVVKVRNLASGAETELYRRRPGGNSGMAKISPDGRFVAFLDSVDAETSALMVVPSGGGAAREVARVKTPAEFQLINGYAWSHDSRYVYFFKRADSRAPHRLYRVSVTGGAEDYMNLEGMELRGMAIAPDGRQILFNIGPSERPEIWAMENFLPAGK